MTEDQKRQKLREIFGQKYKERFYAREDEWSTYVHSIGCVRSLSFPPGSFECPDSYHRAYPARWYPVRWIQVPEELAVKFLVLGLP